MRVPHQRIVELARDQAAIFVRASEDALKQKTIAVRAALLRDGFSEKAAAASFALIGEFARRRLGITLHDTQLIAASYMLDNRLAEMQTGEGKTFAALLTAGTAALAGVPVHVITANDYLVVRDAEILRPVYTALGIMVGMVTQPNDRNQRRAAYACDITYCTAKELIFDYLRDRLAEGLIGSDLQRRAQTLRGESKEAPLLRGLCMALVDEADSILIDEAATPFVISRSRAGTKDAGIYLSALDLARTLQAKRDFAIERQSVILTESGKAALEQLPLNVPMRRHAEIVRLALTALHTLTRDRDYLVHDGRVQMIDETTGRVAAGRVFSRGIQQLLEIKEGVRMSAEVETIAQMTYQRFFPRYLRLCGMSGTVVEERSELRSVYGLRVAKVPLRFPSARRGLGVRVYTTAEAKWRAVIARAQELRREGRPVLIGTGSVADSEKLSALFKTLNVAHNLLNARHDRAEAQLIEHAGHAGQITVATNMAGRGADIRLDIEAKTRGGLHVICCHCNKRRVARQLHGRSSRQGDPGSVETILSLDDELIARTLPVRLTRSLRRGSQLPAFLARLVAEIPPSLNSISERRARRRLMKHDQWLARHLAFAGPKE